MHKKLQFKEPFIGTSDESGITLLYSADGNFSSVLSIENLALQYNADPEIYDEFHTLLGQIVKLLGSSYILQKTDIIATQQYKPAMSEHTDYLQRKYFEHYNGRAYKSITTYITITKTNNKSRFFSYDVKDIKDFVNKINKVVDALQNHKIKTSVLNKQDIETLQRRFISFNFNNDNCFVGNVLSDANALYFGDKQLKVVSLIDIDELNIPAQIGTHGTKPEIGKNFPVDNFSFLLNVPSADTILYNQVIFIPDQIKTKRDLEAKRKKHSSMPDAANKISVEDIDSMFLDIAPKMNYWCFAISAYSFTAIQCCWIKQSIILNPTSLVWVLYQVKTPTTRWSFLEPLYLVMPMRCRSMINFLRRGQQLPAFFYGTPSQNRRK